MEEANENLNDMAEGAEAASLEASKEVEGEEQNN